MATNEQLFQLVMKAVVEPEFGACLLEDPVRAAASIGITDLTDQEIESLEALDANTLAGARNSAMGVIQFVNKADIWHPPAELA